MIKVRRSFAYHLEVVAQVLRPLMGPALALAAVVLGASAGMLATKLSLTTVLMMLGGAAIVFVALSRADFVILLMLVTSSSIIDPRSIPTINVGFKFTAVEMCLMFLLGLLAVRSLSNKGENDFVRTPLDWPVFLFFAASTISYFNAMYNLGTRRGILIHQWRTLFDYLVFFAVTNHVRTRRQFITLVTSMFVMATIVAVLMIIQAAVGPSVPIIPSIRVETARVFDQEFAGVARVLPPGTRLVAVMFLPALILFATPECLPTRKWLLFIPVLLSPVAIAMTFGRTLWTGMVLSLVILLFISPASQRKRFLIVMCVLVTISSLSFFLLNSYFPRVGDVAEALSIRASSLFTGDRIVQDQQRRICENKSAIATFKEHPLLGVGPGGEIHTKMCTERLTRFVHNSYLFILADLGLLGFLPFLWFSVAYLIRGFFFAHKLQDPVLRGLILGFTLSYIATLIGVSAGGGLMKFQDVAVIGVMLGINEMAIRVGQ